MTDLPPRILATSQAQALMRRLAQKHGPLMFHQSGGCCDGSAPMCFPRGEFRTGAQDVLLGHVADDVPVWIGAAQFAYWRHTQVTIDVVPGRGAGMSLESPEGVRFIVRSRIFSDAENALLDAAAEPPRGDAVTQ
ncbi:DUF779 domain-containing protein [Sphingobium sp. HBC34]|uniref:DUF779 domain-containing protein n=1 Tax=Sphingobium cyanobacteriorum TaxID=3063954 RepID=A0ABT8ZNG7_9SPHN|nr:DUF779 domain-containing protein [Sphingobium sp. HBC34]MDO7835658.1 DUF779 domain-containing protein [Sphingobium sp. HBC34]